MSRTRRTRWDGKTIRDGDWGRRCPEAECEWCVHKPPMDERDDINEQHPTD